MFRFFDQGRAPDKTSDMDLLPTWLVQESVPIFAPFFVHVYNVILENGYLPVSQEEAIVYPGHKKPTLDPDALSIAPSQTLASFLNCWSGLIMLSCFFISMTMNCCYQSAYRQFFFTETAVPKVVTDKLTASNRAWKSLLGIYDLRAAFDTVDHAISLRWLKIIFAIQGIMVE